MGVAIATAKDLQLHQQFQAMHESDPVCASLLKLILYAVKPCRLAIALKKLLFYSYNKKFCA